VHTINQIIQVFISLDIHKSLSFIAHFIRFRKKYSIK
jgi:hypothetical protein